MKRPCSLGGGGLRVGGAVQRTSVLPVQRDIRAGKQRYGRTAQAADGDGRVGRLRYLLPERVPHGRSVHPATHRARHHERNHHTRAAGVQGQHAEPLSVLPRVRAGCNCGDATAIRRPRDSHAIAVATLIRPTGRRSGCESRKYIGWVIVCFERPKNVAFFHSKLLLDNSFKFHVITHQG